MHALLGYLLCLVVLTPAFSVDVFFALIGATSRLHDLLAIVRAVSRMLQSVTSPFKIALTVAVLIGVFAADSPRTTRGFILLVASAAGIAGMWQAAMDTPADLFELMTALGPWAVTTMISMVCASRLIAGPRPLAIAAV
jgi:hypothetical protein